MGCARVAGHDAGARRDARPRPCNRYETYLVNTAGQALELVELIGAPNVGVHLDAST